MPGLKKGRHLRGPEDEARAGEFLAGLAAHESAASSSFTVLKAHLALGQLPGGKYAVAFGGGVLLLVVLMVGLTLLGLLV
ncbi:hypothetical protein [Kineosporia sp. NBRC 101677]|uniref:hypothetical protein n=1 Tax=Kineosporia sp. NBRC 101677 TaxID=3032197 RepID=UPI00255511F4|nr:hypothetical protein [Kineosporia sp. NBRC 101677]